MTYVKFHLNRSEEEFTDNDQGFNFNIVCNPVDKVVVFKVALF